MVSEPHHHLPREIMDAAVRVQEPGQSEDGYLEWFLSVSHPQATPPAPTSDVPGHSGTRDSSDPPPPSSPPPAADQDTRLQLIAVTLDNIMVLVNPNGEVYHGLARLADISRGWRM